ERDVKVVAAADSLVLSGTVSDAAAVARVVELASAYVRRPLRALTVPEKEEGPANPNAGAASPGAGGGNAAASQPGVRVINLLSVAAPQQVQLEVKVAEV